MAVMKDRYTKFMKNFDIDDIIFHSFYGYRVKHPVPKSFLERRKQRLIGWENQNNLLEKALNKGGDTPEHISNFFDHYSWDSVNRSGWIAHFGMSFESGLRFFNKSGNKDFSNIYLTFNKYMYLLASKKIEQHFEETRNLCLTLD